MLKIKSLILLFFVAYGARAQEQKPFPISLTMRSHKLALKIPNIYKKEFQHSRYFTIYNVWLQDSLLGAQSIVFYKTDKNKPEYDYVVRTFTDNIDLRNFSIDPASLANSAIPNLIKELSTTTRDYKSNNRIVSKPITELIENEGKVFLIMIPSSQGLKDQTIPKSHIIRAKNFEEVAPNLIKLFEQETKALLSKHYEKSQELSLASTEKQAGGSFHSSSFQTSSSKQPTIQSLTPPEQKIIMLQTVHEDNPAGIQQIKSDETDSTKLQECKENDAKFIFYRLPIPRPPVRVRYELPLTLQKPLLQYKVRNARLQRYTAGHGFLPPPCPPMQQDIPSAAPMQGHKSMNDLD